MHEANLYLALTSTYQVIVEEDRPKKLKRELGGQDCFPVPLTFDDAVSRGSVHYFGAELPASSLTEAKPFTVGDNQTYSGYWNPPLEPKKAYLIYFQAMSNLKGVSSCGTLLQLVGCLGSWWEQEGPHLGSGVGEAEKNGICFRSLSLGAHPQCPARGEVVLRATLMACWDQGWVSPFLPAPLGCPCPPPSVSAGGDGAQPFPSTVVPAGTPTSTSMGETTFLGLILGCERTIWAARAVCTLLGPAADTVAAAESSWDAAEFPLWQQPPHPLG